jgi:hypothetical protein
MKNARAGVIWLKIDGQQLEAKGSFTIQPGAYKREAIVGADGIHDYKVTPQVASIEGAITDNKDLDTNKIRNATNVTVTLELVNGKLWVLEEAWYASEGTMTTEEGEIGIRFESSHAATEVR